MWCKLLWFCSQRCGKLPPSIDTEKGPKLNLRIFPDYYFHFTYIFSFDGGNRKFSNPSQMRFQVFWMNAPLACAIPNQQKSSNLFIWWETWYVEKYCKAIRTWVHWRCIPQTWWSTQCYLEQKWKFNLSICDCAADVNMLNFVDVIRVRLVTAFIMIIDLQFEGNSFNQNGEANQNMT